MASHEVSFEPRGVPGRRTLLRLFVSLAIAAALLALLMAFGNVSLSELLATWSHLSWRVYLIALALHVALYVLRAIRFQILLPPTARPPFVRLLSVCCAHTMAAFILPAKIGEATFVVYARNVCGIPAAEGVAVLVISRLLDMASLFLSMSIACLTLQLTHVYPGIGWFSTLGVTLALASAVLFFMSARGDLLVHLAAALSRLLRLDRFEYGAKLHSKVDTLAGALRRAGNRRRLVGATLISMPLWACVFLFCAVLARGLGLPPETTLADATFGASIAMLASFVPLSAFANFGTLETGWVLGFGILGVQRDLAIATGTGLHVVQLFNAVALGMLGHVGMGFAVRRARPVQQSAASASSVQGELRDD